jgi:hypothetical protein
MHLSPESVSHYRHRYSEGGITSLEGASGPVALA